MIKYCENCGSIFEVSGDSWSQRQRRCMRCGFKANIPTQTDLAKRAKREISDSVQIDSNNADLEHVSYGVYMARKERSRIDGKKVD